MCTHEIWTYPECRCTIDHHVPCVEVEDQSSTSSPSVLSRCINDVPSPASDLDTSLRSHTTRSAANGIVDIQHPMGTSPVNFPPSSSPTPPDSSPNSEDDSYSEEYYHAYLHNQAPRKAKTLRAEISSQRQCSINHTTHKAFLEPICDDCLLDELGIKARYGSGVLPSINGVDGQYDCEGSEDLNHSDERGYGEEMEKEANGENEKRGRGRYGHTRNNTGLIWESDVQIEITPSPTSSRTSPTSPTAKDWDVLDAVVLPTAANDANITSSKRDSVRLRDLPITHDPNKRISSSFDLARRRPWLVKELEAYLKNDPDAADISFQEAQSIVENEADEKREIETEILETPVEVEVLDESGLNDALGSRIPSAVADSPSSPTAHFRFPSTQFPRAPLLNIAHADPGGDIPPRHPSALSTSTVTTNADADDESSLHASSPVPASTLSPNVTTRRPHVRPRSTTKALRRRGMDISRSSFALRISSRWGSGERECLRGFKDDLLGRSKVIDAGVAEPVIATAAKISSTAEKGQTKEGNARRPAEVISHDRAQDVVDKVETVTGDGVDRDECFREVLKSLEDVRPPHPQNDKLGSPVAVGSHHDDAVPPPIKLHRNNKSSAEAKSKGVSHDSEGRGRMRGRSPVKTLLTRFTEAQNGGKSWTKSLGSVKAVRDVLGDLKRSLSRDSGARGRRGKAPATRRDSQDGVRVGLNDVQSSPNVNAVGSGVCTLRAVVGSSENVGTGKMQKLRQSKDEIEQYSREGPGSEVPPDAGSCLSRRGSAQSSEPGSTPISHPSPSSHPSTSRAPASTDDNVYIHPGATSQHVNRMPEQESETWVAHLATDLALPPRSKKHVLQNAAFSMSEVRLPPSSNPVHQVKRRNSSAATIGRNWLSRSSPILPSAEYQHDYPLECHCARVEAQKRLLSTSTLSVPATASPGSSGTWVCDSQTSSAPASGQWQGERLASIVSSSEFEDDDELVGDSWREASAEDKVNAEPATDNAMGPLLVAAVGTPAPATSSTSEQEQEQSRPRNPTPSSAPIFRFKPHPNSHSPLPKLALTQHPLSTPHRVTTPNRPILPIRTSSLSSPPLSTPIRFGMPPSKLTHSPTENFACIWRRYLCAGGCGRVVGEDVGSCICDLLGTKAIVEQVVASTEDLKTGEKAQGDSGFMCRSTAPIVRYVGSAIVASMEDGGDEMGLQVRRMCEQCRVRPDVSKCL